MIFLAPALLIGLGSGYVLAGQSQLSNRDRAAILLASGVMGGLIIGMLLVGFSPLSGSYYFALQIMSCTGGIAVGAASNWVPTKKAPKTSYVTFNPDDDEEFDRQIEEALGGTDES